MSDALEPQPNTPKKSKSTKRRPRPPVQKLRNPLPLNRTGRPPKYDPALCPRVTRLALLGLTDAEIGYQLGINDETMVRWKRVHPPFSKALSAGKIDADANVVHSLYQRATGQAKIPAVKIFLGKDGEPVYAPYVETAMPDVGAAKLWLTNRQPGRWRERREVDVTMTLEAQISALSPADRLARLQQLQMKAAETLGPLIEGEAEEVEE